MMHSSRLLLKKMMPMTRQPPFGCWTASCSPFLFLVGLPSKRTGGSVLLGVESASLGHTKASYLPSHETVGIFQVSGRLLHCVGLLAHQHQGQYLECDLDNLLRILLSRLDWSHLSCVGCRLCNLQTSLPPFLPPSSNSIAAAEPLSPSPDHHQSSSLVRHRLPRLLTCTKNVLRFSGFALQSCA